MESINSTKQLDLKSTDVFLRGVLLLDEANEMLVTGRADEAVKALVTGMKQLRALLSTAEWTRFAKEFVPQHPVCKLIHEDPLSFHSYSKPRGYSGDADLLDYLYGEKPLTSISKLGRAINAATFQAAACQSVRIRRKLLASTIDLLAMEIPRPRILSVACGHLREAQSSIAVSENMIGEYIAFDQDKSSLALVDSEQSTCGVRTMEASVRALLTERVSLSDFDLIYSAGLYDYLLDQTAKRLTEVLFSMLKPGGKLLIGNFAPNLEDIGYMESFMDWHLIYRDEAQVRKFASGIPVDRISQLRMFRDRVGNVVYLELIKA